MMSKWLMLVFFTLVTSNFLLAQQTKFEVHGSGDALYLEHIVTPKENFYSVGRLFNINPKELASFNHLHFASGLNIGQVIKIPLDKNNFTQEENAAVNEVLIPVYHTVVHGETLYRLGVNYNKVSLVYLKKWNHLTSDELSAGIPIIIGFLRVNKKLSALAKERNNNLAEKESIIIRPEIPPDTKEEKPVTQAVAVSAPQTITTNETKINPETNNTPISPQQISSINSTGNSDGGYFKNLYQKQTANKNLVTKSGNSSVFKSTSGWSDSKYYCFSNDAVAGTILKITDNSTKKSVYAKVLDVIPDISINEGVITVISDSAAEALSDGSSNQFDCMVSFAKQ